METRKWVSNRAGLVVCGEFGVAVDAVTGSSFSLDKDKGRGAVMLARLRGGPTGEDVADLLRFVVSDSFKECRAQLGISP